MKIAISLLNFRSGLIGGAETYIRQLIAHLPQVMGTDDRAVLVVHRDNADSIEAPGLERIVADRNGRQIVRSRVMEAFTPLRARWAERLFEKIAPDAVLFPQQSIFPKAIPFPSVMTVLDVQHLFFPEYFSLFDRLFRATIYPYSLRRADQIIAISEYTRKTVIQRCRVPAEKITAVPFGVPEHDVSAIRPTDRIPGPYLYYPAATFPHKNHRTLLRTFAQLKRRGDFAYKLVLTGKRTREWDKLRRLIRELGIHHDVIHPGFVSFDEVQRIYKGADAVVFPTQFEGFGLPVVEAVAFGKKVITSRLEVFDEIGVPQESQIDFANPDELARAIGTPGATRLARPSWTWSENAQATLELLRTAARGDAPARKPSQ